MSHVTTRGCSRSFILCVLHLCLGYVQDQYQDGQPVQFPFCENEVSNWLSRALHHCQGKDFQSNMGGIMIDMSDTSTYWTVPSQFFCWWKNNIERKAKFTVLQKDAAYSGKDKHLYARYSFVDNVRVQHIELIPIPIPMPASMKPVANTSKLSLEAIQTGGCRRTVRCSRLVGVRVGPDSGSGSSRTHSTKKLCDSKRDGQGDSEAVSAPRPSKLPRFNEIKLTQGGLDWPFLSAHAGLSSVQAAQQVSLPTVSAFAPDNHNHRHHQQQEENETEQLCGASPESAKMMDACHADTTGSPYLGNFETDFVPLLTDMELGMCAAPDGSYFDDERAAGARRRCLHNDSVTGPLTGSSCLLPGLAASVSHSAAGVSDGVHCPFAFSDSCHAFSSGQDSSSKACDPLFVHSASRPAASRTRAGATSWTEMFSCDTATWLNNWHQGQEADSDSDSSCSQQAISDTAALSWPSDFPSDNCKHASSSRR